MSIITSQLRTRIWVGGIIASLLLVFGLIFVQSDKLQNISQNQQDHQNHYQNNEGIRIAKNNLDKSRSINQISPPARSHYALAFIDDLNSVLIYGGDNAVVIFNDTWLFNLDNLTWQKLNLTTSPPPLWSHDMVYDSANQRVILFGGSPEPYDCCTWNASNLSAETWEFDYSTSIWSKLITADSPSPRKEHSMVYDSDRGEIYLYGGKFTHYVDGQTWVFNYQSLTWTQKFPTKIALCETACRSTGRSDHDMVYDSTHQKIILFGGWDAGALITNETWMYDPVENVWEQKDPANVPLRRTGHRMAYDINRSKVIMFGGWTSPLGGGTLKNLNDLWVYDSINNNWENITTTNNPPIRRTHEMAYLPIGNQSQIFLFGGRSSGFTLFNDIWTYHYSSQTWYQRQLGVNIDLPPAIVLNSFPEGYSYELNTTGHVLSWIIKDHLPANFTIFRDSKILLSGNWTSGVPIELSVDALTVGTHNYTILAQDGLNQIAFDQIFLTVTLDIYAPDFTSNLIEGSILAGNIAVLISSNEAGNGSVYLNGTLLFDFTANVTANFEFNTSLFENGQYNMTFVMQDDRGNRDTQQITIEIRNPLPTTTSTSTTISTTSTNSSATSLTSTTKPNPDSSSVSFSQSASGFEVFFLLTSLFSVAIINNRRRKT